MRSEVNGNLKNNFNGAMRMKTQLNWIQEKTGRGETKRGMQTTFQGVCHKKE